MHLNKKKLLFCLDDFCNFLLNLNFIVFKLKIKINEG